MPYKKTAKDLAWDRERQKLQSDNHQWCIRCTEAERQVVLRDKEIERLKEQIAKLEAAITELTNSETTPEEVLQKMRKQAELADTMKFLVNGMRGMF